MANFSGGDGSGGHSVAPPPKPAPPPGRAGSTTAAEHQYGSGSSTAAEYHYTPPTHHTYYSSGTHHSTGYSSGYSGGHSSGGGGGSSSGGGGASPAASSGADAAETAANFGYSIAFFNSNPELKALLGQATAQNWNSSRFVAYLQNTQWFRDTSEAMRKYDALKSSDPATYQQQLAATRDHILNVGWQMGVGFGPNVAQHIADQAMQQGWSEDQLKRVMDGMLYVSKGQYRGQAGAFQQQFNQLAGDYGVNISDGTMGNWVKSAVLGTDDQKSIQEKVQQMAASKYVALADRIKGGETVRQIADPYIQSYGKILEVNPDNIKLDDPLIQHALTAKDPKGQPTTQTVYDFENQLRNDPRWGKTQNAQDLMSSTANSILSTFGLAG